MIDLVTNHSESAGLLSRDVHCSRHNDQPANTEMDTHVSYQPHTDDVVEMIIKNRSQDGMFKGSVALIILILN